ncbi:MAG TPA: Hsp20/alpha crystallin family protein [Opitutaceae bacterium]|jgi:HSP20 family protein
MRYIQFTQPSARTFAPARVGGRLGAGIEDEIGYLFGTALSAFAGTGRGQFPVDLSQDKDNTYVRAELPGVARDAIGVEIVDGSLSIKATRKDNRGETEDTVDFSRLVSLPDDVQSDKVSAAYENGILTVTLPRREESKPRKVTVQVS